MLTQVRLKGPFLIQETLYMDDEFQLRLKVEALKDERKKLTEKLNSSDNWKERAKMRKAYLSSAEYVRSKELDGEIKADKDYIRKLEINKELKDLEADKE